jgi:hypothetical protein
MPGNTAPIYSKTGKAAWTAPALTAANTAKDGTGTVTTVFTADATNGSYLQKLIVRPSGTNVASVLRLFLNNGGVNATPANNALFAEVGLVATTSTEVAAQSGFEVPVNMALPPGYRITATLGTAVAGGYMVIGVGGDY